jgi:BCD family chlorophyll transporter-like MFS transporter
MLDPFSPLLLVIVSGCVSLVAMMLTLIGVWGIEPRQSVQHDMMPVGATRSSVRAAIMDVWREPQARRFALFVFVSMLAYSAQDLILEPFAGMVFGFSPGATTKLSSVQHIGTLIGMGLVPLVGAVFPSLRGNLTNWTIIGCLTSAIALLALAAASMAGPGWPLRETVFALGVTNGAYAVAAIGLMMALVDGGGGRREGVRMGIWGAAQAFAFGLGGFIGTVASDVAHSILASPASAYAAVFAAEAGLFVIAAIMAVWVHRAGRRRRSDDPVIDTARIAMAGGV